MRMRTLRMWYGLLLVWLAGRAKWVMRKVGAILKSYGRKLEHLGDDVTPRWGLKIFNQCHFAETEIHTGGDIFCGRIDYIYQDKSQQKQVLVIKLRFLKRRKDALFDALFEQVEDREFRLADYGAPVEIDKDGWSCVWTGIGGGYLSIFFKRPICK